LYDTSITLACASSQADVHIGALAGAGLADRDLEAWDSAQRRFDAASVLIGSRTTWWFQGRELWEALGVHLAERNLGAVAALDVLLDAIARTEDHDAYGALWLGAECVTLLHLPNPRAEAMLVRLRKRARAHDYAAYVAHFAMPVAS
jgi:hypothetical protein